MQIAWTLRRAFLLTTSGLVIVGVVNTLRAQALAFLWALGITYTERQTKPVFNLVLVRAGKTWPQLQAHSDNGSCSTASTPQPPPAAPSDAPAAA
jgi:hypothetical protein